MNMAYFVYMSCHSSWNHIHCLIAICCTLLLPHICHKPWRQTENLLAFYLLTFVATINLHISCFHILQSNSQYATVSLMHGRVTAMWCCFKVTLLRLVFETQLLYQKACLLWQSSCSYTVSNFYSEIIKIITAVHLSMTLSWQIKK